jgi:hypothetical protein
MIHEWFHNSRTDSKPTTIYHIIDVTDTVLGVERVIYGAGVASAYAWEGIGTGSVLDGRIQEKTMYNADSFAWMVSYNWYEKVYGWVDDGRWKGSTVKERREEIANGTLVRRNTKEKKKRESMWKRLRSLFLIS